MATLKDVARLANVDVSTVSRALNNQPRVHPKTKERIIAAARELGYRPNLVAQSLRVGRRHVIGIIIPHLQLTMFAEVVQGVEAQARQMGYTTVICNTNEHPERERDYLSHLRDGVVDGIVIAGTGKNGELMRDIQAGGIPVTQVIRMNEQSLSSAVGDYRACSTGAVDYLYSCGCRRIGMINGPRMLSPYRTRYEGYREAVERLGLESITTAAAGHEVYTYAYGYRCTKQLLEEHPDLEVIMTAVDVQAMGALRAIHELGRRCPDDIKLVSLTGHTIGNMLVPSITAMEIPATKIGMKAAEMTIENIEAGQQFTTQHLVFSPTLVKRESA